MLLGGDVILTENAELMFGIAEQDVGVEPRVIVADVRLPGAMRGFGGPEYLELMRGMLMLFGAAGSAEQ